MESPQAPRASPHWLSGRRWLMSLRVSAPHWPSRFSGGLLSYYLNPSIFISHFTFPSQCVRVHLQTPRNKSCLSKFHSCLEVEIESQALRFGQNKVRSAVGVAGNPTFTIQLSFVDSKCICSELSASPTLLRYLLRILPAAEYSCSKHTRN